MRKNSWNSQRIHKLCKTCRKNFSDFVRLVYIRSSTHQHIQIFAKFEQVLLELFSAGFFIENMDITQKYWNKIKMTNSVENVQIPRFVTHRPSSIQTINEVT